MDITLEALAYSAILGLRVLIVIGCAAVLAAAVDPDELLRAVRRLSVRSGVTAAVATRMMPVLARDARRMADAQRCRGEGEIGAAQRVAVLRAVTTGALDRATDVAATLEVRGFAGGRRPARAPAPMVAPRPRVRRLGGSRRRARARRGASRAGPRTPHSRGSTTPLEGGALVLACALALCVLAPFADRRGIE